MKIKSLEDPFFFFSQRHNVFTNKRSQGALTFPFLFWQNRQNWGGLQEALIGNCGSWGLEPSKDCGRAEASPNTGRTGWPRDPPSAPASTSLQRCSVCLRWHPHLPTGAWPEFQSIVFPLPQSLRWAWATSKPIPCRPVLKRSYHSDQHALLILEEIKGNTQDQNFM